MNLRLDNHTVQVQPGQSLMDNIYNLFVVLYHFLVFFATLSQQHTVNNM